jgi:hypothetical protein
MYIISINVNQQQPVFFLVSYVFLNVVPGFPFVAGPLALGLP